MDKRTDINNTSFAYSVNLLKMLLAMQLITEDEYEAGRERHQGRAGGKWRLWD